MSSFPPYLLHSCTDEVMHLFCRAMGDVSDCIDHPADNGYFMLQCIFPPSVRMAEMFSF